jgi:hypothetical protein
MLGSLILALASQSALASSDPLPAGVSEVAPLVLSLAPGDGGDWERLVDSLQAEDGLAADAFRAIQEEYGVTLPEGITVVLEGVKYRDWANLPAVATGGGRRWYDGLGLGRLFGRRAEPATESEWRDSLDLILLVPAGAQQRVKEAFAGRGLKSSIEPEGRPRLWLVADGSARGPVRPIGPTVDGKARDVRYASASALQMLAGWGDAGAPEEQYPAYFVRRRVPEGLVLHVNDPEVTRDELFRSPAERKAAAARRTVPRPPQRQLWRVQSSAPRAETDLAAAVQALRDGGIAGASALEYLWQVGPEHGADGWSAYFSTRPLGDLGIRRLTTRFAELGFTLEQVRSVHLPVQADGRITLVELDARELGATPRRWDRPGEALHQLLRARTGAAEVRVRFCLWATRFRWFGQRDRLSAYRLGLVRPVPPASRTPGQNGRNYYRPGKTGKPKK